MDYLSISAIKALTPIQRVCEEGGDLLESSRDCVGSMPAGAVKRGLEAGLEALGGALKDDFDNVNRGTK